MMNDDDRTDEQRIAKDHFDRAAHVYHRGTRQRVHLVEMRNAWVAYHAGAPWMADGSACMWASMAGEADCDAARLRAELNAAEGQVIKLESGWREQEKGLRAEVEHLRSAMERTQDMVHDGHWCGACADNGDNACTRPCPMQPLRDALTQEGHGSASGEISAQSDASEFVELRDDGRYNLPSSRRSSSVFTLLELERAEEAIASVIADARSRKAGS